MPPRFFESREALRAWFEEHHATAVELHLGIYKKASGRPSVGYEEAVEECLCFGWIDGVRRTIDAESYQQRLTPRRPGSNWSDVNIRRMQRLIEEGRVAPAGLAAFEAWDPSHKPKYSYENRPDGLGEEYEARFRGNPDAWQFFEQQPPWYRRTTAFWVLGARQEATRERRLQQLIEDSAAGVWVGPMRINQTRGKPSRN